MSIVYVIGAGASHGSTLIKHPETPKDIPVSFAAPPLANGFFKRELYRSVGYTREQAEADYGAAFSFIQSVFLSCPPAEKAWEMLNLEEVFTFLELNREFSNPESDLSAHWTVVRNQLVRYTWRILGLCTQYMRSDDYARLAASLEPDDTVICFNWDLLLDQELHPTHALGKPKAHYSNFLVLVLRQWLGRTSPFVSGGSLPGMLLKLHGSLNWLQCKNSLCPATTEIELEQNTQSCLSMNMGIGGKACDRCGSEMLPLIIPPILNKPITNDSIICCIWGLAKQRLERASHAVIIGFSVAPTDYYAAWLLRSTLGASKTTEIFVVNPANDPENSEHNRFSSRQISLLFGLPCLTPIQGTALGPTIEYGTDTAWVVFERHRTGYRIKGGLARLGLWSLPICRRMIRPRER